MGFIGSSIIGPAYAERVCGKEIGGKVYEHDSIKKMPLRESSFFRELLLGSLQRTRIEEEGGPLSCSYFMSVVWKDEDDLAIDFAGYKLDGGWGSNAGLHPWVYKNGIWQKLDGEFGCEETVVLLAEEVKMRRATRTLEEWLSSTLDEDHINEMLEFTVKD
jgi:hypothetical protein